MVAERQTTAEELASLHRQQKAWERGTETHNADGSTVRTWDNGNESAEDSLKQASVRITELTEDLETSRLQLRYEMTETGTLRQALEKQELETKKAAKRFGLLAGMELGTGGEWTDRLRLGGVGFIGPWMVGATVAPGPSLQDAEISARFAASQTTIWTGWAF